MRVDCEEYDDLVEGGGVEESKECEDDDCYEHVNNDSEFLCSEGPNHQPCEEYDTDCGMENICESFVV